MDERADAIAARRSWILLVALLTVPLLGICTYLFFRFLPVLTEIFGSLEAMGIKVF